MQSVENATEEKRFVNCLMDGWLEDELRLEAARRRLSKGEIIRRALIAYLRLEQEGQHATASVR